MLVIDESGQKLGVMDTRDAVRMARSKGLDLIEVAPQARPPVCRIMDYGKFKYQQRKREKEARKHQKELKEIRLTPPMDEHDFLYRARNAEEFLRDGHRVRVFMQIRGRWMAHTDLCETKLKAFVEHLKHIATVESPLSQQGNVLSVVLAPRKDIKKPAQPEAPKPAAATPPPSAPPMPPPTAPQPPSSEQEPPKVIEVTSGEQ